MPEITSFLGCFFTLKIQKKSAQTITEVSKPPRNYSPDPLRGGESYLRSLFPRGILGHFGTSEAQVRHVIISGKIAEKVIANMILHPAGGLASSSEGVLTLL